jgi:hypothetical protein
MDGACGMYVLDVVCRILIRKQLNKTRGRTRHEWEDDIKVVPKEVRCDVVGWIHIGKDRICCWAVVNKEMKFRIL